MTSVTERLEVLITSTAKGFTSDIKEATNATGVAEQKTSALQTALNKLGIEGDNTGQLIKTGLQVGAVGALAAAGTFAVKAVDQFASLTGEVLSLQRVMGGTAEDASRVSAAIRISGVDAEGAEKSFGQLAKRIGEGKDTLATWGVQVAHDKQGNVDMASTLENIAARYQQIQDPAQRAAFLFENFGRSGQQIAPLLLKTKEQLQEIYDTAAQNHQIFSQEDLQKGKEYQETVRQLKETLQGLAVEVGSDVLPALQSLVSLFTGALHVLDAAGHAVGGFNVSAVAMGALIGTAIAPGLGTAIGAAVGLTGAIASLGNGTNVTSNDFKNLATSINAVDTAAAVHKFNDLVNKFRDVGEETGTFKALELAAFRELADQSPAAAQKVIDGLTGQGKATGDYKKVLDEEIGKLKEAKTNTDAASAANDALTGSTRSAASATTAETQALDDVQNKLLGVTGDALSYQQAVDSQAKAQGDYNDAVAAYGPNSQQAHDALLNLQQAQLGAAQSALNLDDHEQALLDTVSGSPETIQAEITKLEREKQLHPEVAGSIDPLISKLYLLSLQYDSIPAAKHTDVGVSVDRGGLDALIADINNVTGSVHQVTIDVAGAIARGL